MGKKGKRTFRKNKKRIKRGTRTYTLYKNFQKVLLSVGTDFKESVKCPPDVELNEWLSVAVIDFYNKINLLYGAIAELCTNDSCPIMNAGPGYSFYWRDPLKDKVAKRVSAPEYVDRLMAWIEECMDNPEIFPEDGNGKYPKNFVKNYVSVIFRRFARVFAHIYHAHYVQVRETGIDAHINTLFQHFYYFSTVHDLVPKEEFEPLEKIIKILT